MNTSDKIFKCNGFYRANLDLIECDKKWKCRHFGIKKANNRTSPKMKSKECVLYEYAWPKLIGTKHEN